MTDYKREVTFNDGAQGPRKVTVNYPSNSNKAKAGRDPEAAPERKHIEKVISGEVVQRKKGLGRKIAETFTGDSLENTANYILFDVVIPQVKTMVADAFTQGLERKLFGTVRSRSISPATRGVTHVNYNSVSRNSVVGRAGEADGPRAITARARAAHDFDEIIIDDRGEADYVIDMLTSIIEQYKVASVADLYDLVGITSSFTDQSWGWSSMKDAGVIRTRNGFLLNLPPTENISG